MFKRAPALSKTVCHVGQIRELRAFAQDSPHLATSDSWKDSQGQRQERTEWHRVVAWDKLAEIAKEYLAKGKQVYIEGRLQTRSWEDKDGHKRYTTEVRADQMVMLGGRGGDDGGGARDAGPPPGPDEDFTREPFKATDEDVPF